LHDPASPQPSDDEAVPLFRTWRVAYGAVIACNLLVLLLLYLFSRWAF
jgi:hypothetical protein